MAFYQHPESDKHNICNECEKQKGCHIRNILGDAWTDERHKKTGRKSVCRYFEPKEKN